MDQNELRQLIFTIGEATPYDRTQWQPVLIALQKDMGETIRFLESDYCPETFFYLSLLFPELSAAFQSREFTDFLRRYLNELLDSPYCMLHFVTPLMQQVDKAEFEATMLSAILEAEAALSLSHNTKQQKEPL